MSFHLHIFALCIRDVNPNITKRERLFNALAEKCNIEQNSDCVYDFIKETFQPSRWLSEPNKKAEMILKINEVLALKGRQLDEHNNYIIVKAATTVSEAKARASRLSEKLCLINAHYLVLNCCKEELLVSDYFHAVHEAAKSLTKRISTETGLKKDGADLLNSVFSINNPMAFVSKLSNKSEINEQNGIREMLLGINCAVRNVTAHEMRIHWDIDEETAINYLTIISSLHKILDKFQFLRID